jgi:hypothetical protein
VGQLRIYMHPSGEGAMHRSGFSWTAALAFPFWALTKRLYKTTVAWFGCLLVVGLLPPRILFRVQDDRVRGLAMLACMAAYWLLCGFFAGRWHRHVLERRGFFVSAEEAAS